MKRILHTKSRALVLKMQVLAKRPLNLAILVRDPSKPNTDYFRRGFPLGTEFFDNGLGIRNLEIPLPISPRTAELILFDKNSSSQTHFALRKLQAFELIKRETWASEAQKRFMAFAIAFSREAGHLKPGFYPSRTGEFLIHYRPQIRDRYGMELATPARIQRYMPRLEISQKLFRSFSIPVRVAILAHESCHFFLNTRSETQADLCGIRYYLDSGFSKIEALYAATKVFLRYPDQVGPEEVKRTQDLFAFIKTYNQRHPENLIPKP